VAQSITQLLSRRTLRLARSTYTDLISTGNIRLLRNARLRDDLARLQERNERALAIRDRNNQVFVDEMFFAHVLETGLIAPRPGTTLPMALYQVTQFGQQVAVPVTEEQDRLWKLGPGSAEWAILANKVWYRSFVSFAAIEQAKAMVADTAAVRKAIAEELDRNR
jgi:hypothetical protein